MKTIGDFAIREWAKDQLSHRVKRLIAMAKFCLFYGPDMEGQDDEGVPWPGWNAALSEIREAMDNIGEVWVETSSDFVSTNEPEGYSEDNPDYDPDDPDSEEKVWVEPNWEDYVHFSARETRRVIVGELAEYL